MTAQAYDDVIRNWDELDWVTLDDAPGLRVCALRVDQDRDATVVAMDYPPGFRIAVHHHTVDHLEVVLSGEVSVADRPAERAGDFRFVPRGTVYGPLVAGPDGARVIEVFPDDTVESVQGRFRGSRASAESIATRNRDTAAKLGLRIGEPEPRR